MTADVVGTRFPSIWRWKGARRTTWRRWSRPRLSRRPEGGGARVVYNQRGQGFSVYFVTRNGAQTLIARANRGELKQVAARLRELRQSLREDFRNWSQLCGTVLQPA